MNRGATAIDGEGGGEAAAAAAAAGAAAATGSRSNVVPRKKGSAPAESVEQGRPKSSQPTAGSRSSKLENGHDGAATSSSVEGTAAASASAATSAATSAAGGTATTARPPRSPIKQTKACVPTLEDALDDVQVRFVLNLPEAELSSADRLFFQLEQAWWFYEDFIADAHKHLPHFKLKEFAKLLFEHCEALRPLSGKYNELFEHFRSWKGTIPTAGCILLNAAMTKVVLVKCWKGSSRGLPKGKINQGEPAIAAAVREVMEETGYDATAGANEKDFLTLYVNGQQTTMYIVTGVDEEFPFEPQVRKEISAIEWFPLDSLPSRAFGVEPFIPRLRRWMAKTKGIQVPKSAAPAARTQSLVRVRKGSSSAAGIAKSQSQPSSPTGPGRNATGNTPSSSKKQNRKGNKSGGGAGGGGGAGKEQNAGAPTKSEKGRACSAPNRRGNAKGYDAHNRDTFGGGGSGTGEGDNVEDGWDFEAMLSANERLTGRTFVYDGNPHEFGDPAHAARVVQGEAAGGGQSAPGPSRAEDQVGHVKQRGGSVKDGGGGGGGGGGGPPRGSGGEGGRKGSGGDAGRRGEGGGARSRSRGKGKENAKTGSSGDVDGSGKVPENGAPAATDDGELSTARHQSVSGSSSGIICTEGADGGQGQGQTADGRVASCGRGSVGPAAAAAAVGNSGLFGEFKFDMLDIMSAVPQG